MKCNDKQCYKLGIVGLGPRGLFALEQLLDLIETQRELLRYKIVLFEKHTPGCGQVYEVNQSHTNWINVADRFLQLPERTEKKWDDIVIPSFPSYHDWIGFNKRENEAYDIYRSRATLGSYLKQRYESLVINLLANDVIEYYAEEVVALQVNNNAITIKTIIGKEVGVDEVLLTIGHQPTQLSEEDYLWQQHAETNKDIRFFKHPYPIEQYKEISNITEKNLAIKGFGLAMIDVVSGIAEQLGEFKVLNTETQQYSYETEHKLQQFFVPFSLDGLPMAPKPINATIDHWFKPAPELVEDFSVFIGDSIIQKNAKDESFLIDIIAPIITVVYMQLKHVTWERHLGFHSVKETVIKWLKDENFTHQSIINKEEAAINMMKQYVNMAVGKAPISLDYCIGQVWRHCQPIIYEKLSYSVCNDEVIKQIISLDERLKRYAYGPPVASIQQLIALVQNGIMTLDFINNPSIEITDSGWELKKDNKKVETTIVINSVLDAPEIKQVTSPLIKELLRNNFIHAIHDDLGVHTNTQGMVISSKQDSYPPLAILGRLAKGTIIGVDAILECFGKRPQHWAEGFISRNRTRAL